MKKVNSFFFIMCLIFLSGLIFPVFLFSAEKTLSVSFAPILQKQIFFGSPQIKKPEESSVLSLFVSGIQPPKPIDRIYSLTGIFSYSDEPGKNTAVLTENSSKKIIFLKVNDIINGNRVLAINDNGIIFESALGDKFTLTQSGIKYNQALPQRFYFKVNTKNAIQWLKVKPEFLSTIKFVLVNGLGFDVQEIEPGSVFEAAGFGKNDRIIQINDTILKKPSDAIAAYNEIFKTGKKLAIVRLVRNNRPVELVYILE